MIHAIKKIKKKKTPQTPKARFLAAHDLAVDNFHILNIARRDARFNRIAHSFFTTCSQI
jgi:hypothetical protein